ncbi:hypothetical protein K402DRAFT_400297 [Aulographum hederae CBS 113979]|uniref:Uncharacterized protein n=1 Tax=Aulographum hederae CBS 113979 TaxID=1176131 RepID=A0A6G1HF66_9PEZI|nr:hypothetical protein K402DRAFT_400297 [Aulographum hederae CBS 113979]
MFATPVLLRKRLNASGAARLLRQRVPVNVRARLRPLPVVFEHGWGEIFRQPPSRGDDSEATSLDMTADNNFGKQEEQIAEDDDDIRLRSLLRELPSIEEPEKFPEEDSEEDPDDAYDPEFPVAPMVELHRREVRVPPVRCWADLPRNPFPLKERPWYWPWNICLESWLRLSEYQAAQALLQELETRQRRIAQIQKTVDFALSLPTIDREESHDWFWRDMARVERGLMPRSANSHQLLRSKGSYQPSKYETKPEWDYWLQENDAEYSGYYEGPD